MKVFLDTNILIDVLEQRNGYEQSLEILQKGMDGDIQLSVTDLSLVNVVYICRKSAGIDKLYDFITLLCKFIEVIEIGKIPIIEAIKARPKDFEDYVQYAAAKRHGADCIVTRNVKDFPLSDIGILTPDDFLTSL